MKLPAQCYAGLRGEEEPRAFDLGDRRIEIMEIIDRWLSPDHRYFRVRAYDGRVHILRDDEAGELGTDLVQAASMIYRSPYLPIAPQAATATHLLA